MAEQRLIDANALIDWLTRATGFRTNCDDCTDIDCLNCIIEEAIKNAPTIEAKPIVHCKDCYCFSYMGSVNKYYCDCYGGYVTDEDYCSRPTPKNSNCGAQMDEEAEE